MAIESPLFQSSMELYGHSISHFNGSTELDRKLVILHLANAVELILKDLVLGSGKSIYKNPKETLSIHSCIHALKDNISIPYLNKIELLIDERNALQHRFGSPNELTTIFYMTIAQEFFKEILQIHYNQDYEEVVTQFAERKELLAFRLREPNNDTELDYLRKLSIVHPLGALLFAMAYLERTIIDFCSAIGLEKFSRTSYRGAVSHHTLEKYGIDFPNDIRKELDETRRLRNMAAHGRKEPTETEVNNAIDSIEKFENFLSKIDRKQAKELAEVHEKNLPKITFSKTYTG